MFSCNPHTCTSLSLANASVNIHRYLTLTNTVNFNPLRGTFGDSANKEMLFHLEPLDMNDNSVSSTNKCTLPKTMKNSALYYNSISHAREGIV